MSRLLKVKVNLGFLVNPFYLYCLSFSLAIIVYSWGWSIIFPKLSVHLLMFFALSFVIFILAGYCFGKLNFCEVKHSKLAAILNDLIFGLIIFLGAMNVLMMGYLPILDRSQNYREFGAPVIDPVFNTLSIFFSVFYLQTFLSEKKKKYLFYILVILLIQILLFRRSTIVWIVVSSTFLLLKNYGKVGILAVLAALVLIPLFSISFSLYGNYRSKLTKSFIIDKLGASNAFKQETIGYNHYMTYLYLSSPLANLQKNIDESIGFSNKRDFKNFIFFGIIPESLTIRLSKAFSLNSPNCSLINPELIVGTFLMISFYTMGWTGMIVMLLFLFVFIIFCLKILNRWNTFQMTSYCILSTAVSLLIFSNFLNRLDVVIMLFVYPIFFHFIYTKESLLVSKH